MAEYAFAAPEVAQIAKKVIADWHHDLLNVPVLYMMVDDMKTRNKTVLAKIKKMSALEQALTWDENEHNYELMVIVNETTWLAMSESQRVALLDHEFCHVEMEEKEDGSRKLAMVGHDVEEFAAVIKRHGLWKHDLEEFGDTLRQLDLFADAEVDPENGVVSLQGRGRRARPAKPEAEAAAAAT